jgi:hypothetical protein
MRRPAPESGAEDRALARLLGHRFGPLVEGLAAEESFVVRAWFGFLACYAHGRLMLVLADKRPPWSGILVPCDRGRHAALRAVLPWLRAHSVLGKWLLLRPSAPTFEDDALRLVDLARADDPRLGVEPQVRAARRLPPQLSRRAAPAPAPPRPSRSAPRR